jgi:hypothetical protein
MSYFEVEEDVLIPQIDNEIIEEFEEFGDHNISFF